jgi:hypothetical protein
MCCKAGGAVCQACASCDESGQRCSKGDILKRDCGVAFPNARNKRLDPQHGPGVVPSCRTALRICTAKDENRRGVELNLYGLESAALHRSARSGLYQHGLVRQPTPFAARQEPLRPAMVRVHVASVAYRARSSSGCCGCSSRVYCVGKSSKLEVERLRACPGLS